jgi:hypothetical protein
MSITKRIQILLQDLKLIRLGCHKKGCEGVIEFPVENLDSRSRHTCPFCGAEYYGFTGQDPFKELAWVLRELKKANVRIEFVIDEPPDGEPN